MRDHILSRSKGGALAPANKALACGRGNIDKESRTLGSRLHLLRQAGDRPADVVAIPR
jgi:5-methylcytosine-specific restriction endonuclease McrA